MAGKRKVSRSTTVRMVVAAVALMLLGGGSFYYYSLTIVNWWAPVAGGLVGGLIVAATRIAILHRERQRPSWLSSAFTFGLTGLAGIFLILCSNYTLADHTKLHTEHTEVVARLKKEHNRTRVVRGRYIRTGSKYYTYALRLRFENGAEKDFPVSLSEYNRTRTGSIRQLPICSGALGYPVIVK